MMMFDKQKKQILTRVDKSKKGSIDIKIRSLVSLINSLDNYFTSSSCSGRIFLIEVSKSKRKDESRWLFMKHSNVNFSELKNGLLQAKDRDVWLRQESFILHICCRDIEAAVRMLKICQEAGLKRAGIVTIARKIMIEVFGTERLDIIVSKKGNLIVTDDYLKIAIKEANEKHMSNLNKIIKLENKIKIAFTS